MYRLLSFLRRIHVLLIFLILEGFALYLYAGSTTHSRARMLGVSDNMARGLYGWIAAVDNFVGLGKTNRLLEQRLEHLENELAAYREHYSAAQLDSIGSAAEFPHEYVMARVVRNTINKRENYIMVDRGTRDGVERGMAVVSLDGCMVGYVESCSARNAICVSALNTAFATSGMVAHTGDFGSISWPGEDIRTVRLSEVPKYANIAQGDSIFTHGSFYFPEGILIGTVENFTVDEARASYDIDVRLGTDIAALRVVMLVKNPAAYERIKLEEEVLGTAAP